jgi:hypothetical protein
MPMLSWSVLGWRALNHPSKPSRPPPCFEGFCVLDQSAARIDVERLKVLGASADKPMARSLPAAHGQALFGIPRGRAPAASSREVETSHVYRGFKHWFVSYAFLPCYRTRPDGGRPLLDRQGLLPPSVPPRTSDCPSASPDRYGGRGQGLSPHPVIWRLVAQGCCRTHAVTKPGLLPNARASTRAGLDPRVATLVLDVHRPKCTSRSCSQKVGL